MPAPPCKCCEDQVKYCDIRCKHLTNNNKNTVIIDHINSTLCKVTALSTCLQVLTAVLPYTQVLLHLHSSISYLIY